MSNYTIKRLNLSPYQDPEYNFWEKEMVNGLNLSYLSQDEKFDSAHGSPFVLISNTHTNWEEIPERALEQTKLIIHPNSGYDNYSLEFLRQWDIPIVLGNPIRSGAVANYILTSLFTHFNQLPKRHSWDNSRKWDRELLIQKNILIIGHGHIGKILEQTLKPVVAKILVYDPYCGKNIDLKMAAKESDIVIPVAGLNTSSKHIINQDFLDLLPDNFLLINGSRGELVDTEALFFKLKNKREAFAYLDVFENEPFNFRTVDHLSNLCLSSHIAGCHRNLDRDIIGFIKSTLEDYMNLSWEQFQQNYHSLLLQNKILDNRLI